jgi:hypothetical protein
MLARPRIEKRRVLHRFLPRVCLDRAIINLVRLYMALRPPRHDRGGGQSFVHFESLIVISRTRPSSYACVTSMLARPRIEKRRVLHSFVPRVCLDRAIINLVRLYMALRPPRHDLGGGSHSSILNFKFQWNPWLVLINQDSHFEDEA